MKNLLGIVQDYFEKPAALWEYGNSVLYRMCEEHPFHNDVDIIAGKLLLIGRTYAAAIERRKTNDGYRNDEFYYSVAAPKMVSVGEELDDRIARLKACAKPAEDNIDELILTHKFLTDTFSELTELNKRSLASKYLHFHCPHMVYIYDSRADAGIKKLIKKNSSGLRSCTQKGDTYYTDFAVRCLGIQELVEKKCRQLLSPRDIDNILLGYVS